MGLSVAVGAKSVSSRLIELADPEDEFADDGTSLSPVAVVAMEINAVATAISADQEFQVIVAVSYYDMIREDTRQKEYTVAAVKIQIIPSTGALTTRHRDSVHRIKLPPPSRSSNLPCSDRQCPTTRLDVTFSSDRKFLTCLIPCPGSPESAAAAAVVFQLRRPRSTSILQQSLPPPLPSYIQRSSSSAHVEITAPVATNPRQVQLQDGSTFITAIEDVATTPPEANDATSTNANADADAAGPSLLLAGCGDGSILAISYRPFVVAGSFFRPQQHEGDASASTTNTAARSIRQLKHITEWQDAHKGTFGKLVAILSDGTVSLFQTHMLLDDKSDPEDDDEDATDSVVDNSERSASSRHSFRRHASIPNKHGGLTLLLSIEAMQTIVHGSFTCAEWVSSSYLALMARQTEDDTTRSKVQVWGIHSVDDGWALPSSLQVMSTWEITLDRLLENAHTAYVIDDDETDLERIQPLTDTMHRGLGNVALHYDAVSDCLAISAVLGEKKRAGGESAAGAGTTTEIVLRRPFVCIWSWRCNVEGILVMPANPTTAFVLSELLFSTNMSGARKLIHMIAGGSDSLIEPRIRKEIYDASVMSMSSNRLHPRARVQRSNYLLVGSTSVSYPHVSKASAIDDYTVEWQEAKIPFDYLHSRGSPRLAAVGQRIGKSVAVASSRGLCALVCGEKLSTQTYLKHDRGREQLLTGAERALKQTRATPRWYRFGNEAEEGAFRVLALSWWEGSSVSDDAGAVSDDILVCLIEIVDGHDKGCYLSCWAQRRFDLNHQLLQHLHDRTTVSRWGIKLPASFNPTSLDLLENPKQVGSPIDRKAVVLLTDHSPLTSFRVYRLGPVKPNAKGSHPGMLPYSIFAEYASSGSIGSSAEIFLASASFAFDTRTDDSQSRAETDYVATIGVIRPSGAGVDALALSRSSICAVGQVVNIQNDRRCSELNRYWYADFIEKRHLNNEVGPLDFFVWSLQLANGTLVCWSVPLVSSNSDILLQPTYGNHPSSVHPRCMILGYTSFAGTTSTWMQQPSMGPKKVFSLGPVPRSSFGIILGSGQGCRKLHRSLSEDFEHQLFRPDFLDHEMFLPSEFVLSLPSFVPSLFCLTSDTVQVHANPEMDVSCVFQHLHRRAKSCLYRESAAMSLELLILRVLESIPMSQDASPQPDKFQAVYAVLVEALRIHSTPLQFAKLLLEVGRQVEPSYFRHMFPLPGLTNGGRHEDVHDLFDLSLDYGAISVAVAFLPLFEDGDRIRSSCAAVFHQCLHAISEVLSDHSLVGFDILPEERATIGDLFRYALKVEDTRDDSSASTSDDASSAGWSDGSLAIVNDQRNEYTLMCGLSRIFGRKRREDPEVHGAAASFISHGFEHGPVLEKSNANGHQHINGVNGHGMVLKCDVAESVAGVSARFLLASVFDVDVEAANPNRKWQKTAATAAILVGENSSSLPLCPKLRFLELLEETNNRVLESLVVAHHGRRVGLVEFFVRSIRECQSEIPGDKAGLVLDLVLILLNRHGMSDDLSLETPGLLLIAIVVGHASDRISAFLTEGSFELPVINAYFDAAFELASS